MCGDALIDLLPSGKDESAECFVPVCGGSCRNVAVGVARLGMAVAFVGAVGNDRFGDMLSTDLSGNGVKTDYLQRVDESTTCGFVFQVVDGSNYQFYSNSTADSMWALDDRADELLEDARWLHVGSVTLARGLAAEGLERVVYRARDRGQVISFDPNVRLEVSDDVPRYVDRIMRLASIASVVKVSEEDLVAIGVSESQFVAECLAGDCTFVAVTRGKGGSVGYVKGGGFVTTMAAEVEVVDAVGAGDGYMAGMITALVNKGVIDDGGLRGCGTATFEEVMRFSSVVAGLTCSRVGANPPTISEVREVITLPTG